MRTSAESVREQAARFFAMAAQARDEGNVGLADLLTEAARRAAAAVEPTLPQAEQQETVLVQQRQKPIQDGNPDDLTPETAAGLNY